MRLTIPLDILLVLLATSSPSAVSAWTPSAASSSFGSRTSSSSAASRTSLSVGQGWDNDDFLNSLSGASNDRERVTEEYFAQSRFGKDLENMPPPPIDDIPLDEGGTKGAVITEEMKQRIKEQNEKDESQGGTMFKELLAKAQKQKQQQPSQGFPAVGPNNAPSVFSVEPYFPQQQQQQAPVQQQQQPPSVTPESLAGLTVEQQAELFRQMIAGNANAQQGNQNYGQAPAPMRNSPGNFPQAYPPQGAPVAADGRRVGRNRDADQIQNSADLYFAQLKRDSAIRKEAWMAGDQDRANAVFADPSIKEIEERISPFLEERKKNELIGQAPPLIVETSMDEALTTELLGPPQPAKPLPTDYSNVSYKEKMRQLREKKTGTSTSAASVPVASSVSAPAAPVAQPKAAAPVVSQPVPVAASAPAAVAPPKAAGPPSEDDKRSDIRTLMGLLLKHRGGPGFGAGRLKGDEVELYNNLSSVLVQVLKEEGFSVPQAVAATQAAPATLGQGAGGVTTEKVNSLISVLEGAITMYKNSPPALRPSVLGVLNAALITAVTSLDEILGNQNSDGPAAAAAPDATSEERIQSMVACVEAACQVYKNSPPELQQPILVTLRAAFVSAGTTLSGIMANNKEAAAAVSAAPVAVAQPVAPALVAAPATPATAQTYSGKDENTQFLEGVYSKLSAAAGDDKLGLRNDITSDEAADLADSIAEMRMRLVDELENDIPE